MQHFLIFGSHPMLSLAEAKAVLGGRKPLLAKEMAIVDLPSFDSAALQDRLAGTVKLGEIIGEFSIQELTGERLAQEIAARPRGGKIEFGLTIYGGSTSVRAKIKKLPLNLKRALQEQGHSVRWVTGEKGEVTPAAVAKAHLIDQGYDLVIGIFGERALIGLTTHVQDANAWSARDYGRPFRDELTGMLPPKLARLMVNLALGSSTTHSLQAISLLDPFCGGGTVLMEAALLDVGKIIGSDIDQRQVKGSEQNLDWLAQKEILNQSQRVSVSTFTQAAEQLDRTIKPGSIDVLVTEGYLGRPSSGEETLPTLEKQKKEIEDLWRRSLQTFAKLQKRGGRIVCAWPVFVSSHGIVAVDLKGDFPRLGYRQIDPLGDWIDTPPTLTYSRPGQRVRRNILVLEKQ